MGFNLSDRSFSNAAGTSGNGFSFAVEPCRNVYARFPDAALTALVYLTVIFRLCARSQG